MPANDAAQLDAGRGRGRAPAHEAREQRVAGGRVQPLKALLLRYIRDEPAYQEERHAGPQRRGQRRHPEPVELLRLGLRTAGLHAQEVQQVGAEVAPQARPQVAHAGEEREHGGLDALRAQLRDHQHPREPGHLEDDGLDGAGRQDEEVVVDAQPQVPAQEDQAARQPDPCAEDVSDDEDPGIPPGPHPARVGKHPGEGEGRGHQAEDRRVEHRGEVRSPGVLPRPVREEVERRTVHAPSEYVLDEEERVDLGDDGGQDQRDGAQTDKPQDSRGGHLHVQAAAQDRDGGESNGAEASEHRDHSQHRLRPLRLEAGAFAQRLLPREVQGGDQER
mmetsp:Transcript_76662/g.228512  ORF Transcript_76662/g.228512 Transcript_76662/m.228512 type:complete len:333 (+) Transcript_76662:210-1208(+)